MDKVVITGSSGRIGRALHWRLCQEYDVHGIDLSPSSATSHIFDIRDEEKLLRCLEGVHTVFHSAALHAPHVGIATEQEFYDINVNATEKICKAALACGVSQLVFTSTTALYGYANLGEGLAVWVDEQTVPQPRTIYHRTKLEAEQLLSTFASNDLKISVIRMSRCFPEPAPVMAVYRLHRGVDHRDVADAHLLAMELRDKKEFDIYVVSGRTPFLKSDSKMLFEDPERVILERLPSLAEEFKRRGWRFPASIDRVYDSSYAQQVLGWKPRRDAFEVIRQFDNCDFETLPPK